MEKIDVLIVTAAGGEDTAVKKIFGDGWLTMAPTQQPGNYWDKITLTSKQGRRFTAGLVRSEMGAESAGIAATLMLQQLRPSCLAMCGICAGHPDDTKPGDVIIADKVFRYDSKSVKRLDDDSVEERWETSTFPLAVPWWQLAQRLEIEGIKIHVGPIATGEALQRDPAVWETIRKYQRKCIGLDMEASVIGHAAHFFEKRWAVIKGVSDHATPEKNDTHHVLAKENAAKVLKEFLENAADQLAKIDDADKVWLPSNTVDGQTVNPKNTAPSTLLHARNEIVPFSDAIRQPEFEALRALCRPDSRGIIQLFTGPGGIGKTRLMLEWRRRLKEMDPVWQTCFLGQGIDPDSQDFKDFFSRENHLFFVIDYAECRTNLSAILKVLINAAAKKPDRMVRAALVARHMGDWWKELASNNLDIGDYLNDRVVELRNVPTQDNTRQRLFDDACRAFAEKTNKHPGEETKTNARAILTDPVFGRVLYIHMAAYATVAGLDFSAQDLLDVIVSYEKHFWTILFNKKNDGDPAREKYIRDTARVLTALTLFGGVDTHEKLTNLIDKSKGPDDDLFPEFLRNFYPPVSSNKIAGYLEPDLLGEYLVFDTLRSLRVQKNPFTDAAFLTNIFNLSDDPEELQQAFTVLGRVAENNTHKTGPERTMIEEGLSLPLDEAHLITRSLPAVGAALSLAEKTAFCPIPDILTKALEKWGSNSLALEILRILPKNSVAFRRLQLWVTETILNDLKNKKNISEVQQSGYAAALIYYGKALIELGRREDALEVAQEAVDKYRSLAASNADAFLPYLAGSLNNLGVMFSDLGQLKDALEATQEAVDKFRSLAASNAGAFLPDLAGSLNNLGNRLSALGQLKKALEATREAVKIRRRLAASRPDAFLPDLAISLNNLGNILSALGQFKDSLKVTREAVEIQRKLVASRPDAFLPDLAMSLNSLGNRLNELGRRKKALEAALEAVEKYRSLAASRPDAFLHDLAMSLNNLGNRLSALGQLKKALEATREAVDTYRALAVSHTDAFLPDLVTCLNNLGIILNYLAQHEEALEAYNEALPIIRPLAQKYPQIFEESLYWNLLGKKITLQAMGREMLPDEMAELDELTPKFSEKQPGDSH